MARYRFLAGAAGLAATLLVAIPAHAQEPAAIAAPALPDPELAAIRGKFVLSNGAEIAIAVTSDLLVNNQLLLRTVFAIDKGVSTNVYARPNADDATKQAWAANASMPEPNKASVSVMFDRQSGTQTITPTYAVAPHVTVTGATADPGTAGLTEVPVVLGGPAVQTVDGTVALSALRNGTQVTFSGDQLDVSQLVGQAIATAVLNTGSNRTIDTATNIDIDLRDITPFSLGSAALNVNAMALDAARGMVR